MKESTITAVSTHEVDNTKNHRMLEIRFDCLVQMYEMGTRTIKGGLFWSEKALPPQWFKLHERITLEAIKHMDEYTLGRRIKEMFQLLELHIEKYEES